MEITSQALNAEQHRWRTTYCISPVVHPDMTPRVLTALSWPWSPQSALGMMQLLEDSLIEQAHTKPLLPSQLIRYREVQVPDGRSNARPCVRLHGNPLERD